MINSLNLKEIDQEQALNLTKFFIKSKQNIFLFGRRGTGKTDIALQAAKECNLKVNYINLSVIERPDLAGYPNVNSDSDVITFKSPYFLPTLKDGAVSDSIILFDELDKAPAEVTSPLLEILQFKRINGKPINAAACLLTGNLLNEGAYSNLISTALLDRGAKYILAFDFQKWLDWAKLNNVNDLITGFLRSNPEFACGNVDSNCYASPSPRGWTLASNALSKSREHKIVDIETITQIISGFVGAEAGLRFQIWYEYYKKFEPIVHSLIETGSIGQFKFNELMPTEKIIFVISACYLAKQKVIQEFSKTTKNKFVCLDHLCKFLSTNNVDSEVQVMGLYNSFDFDMVTKYKLYANKVFFDHFKDLDDRNIISKK